ncbi:MAG: hypothetical protein HOD37_14005 [Bacteroidetes bacterium]|nr:hypothetical protein [Bacteroidota bacterium]
MNKSSSLLFALLTSTTLVLGQNQSTNVIRMGLVADIQYTDQATAGSRHYRESLQKLEEMVNVMNSYELSFIVDLGDRIDRDFASFKPVDAILNRLNAPVIFVPGNHDFLVKNRLKKVVRRKTKSNRGYQSLKQGEWRFIYLNGLDNSLVANPWSLPKHWIARKELKKQQAEKQVNAYDWNGGFSIRQEKWLINQLASATEDQQDIMLFCHQPLSPGNAHSLWNYQNILNLLNDYPYQVFWINGHDHKGGYEKSGKVHLLTLHGMVEGENPSFAVLTIDDEEITLKGFGDQVSIQLMRNEKIN